MSERFSVLCFLLPVGSPSPFPELFPRPGASGVLPCSGPPPRSVGRQGQCSPERPNRKFRDKLRCIKKLKNLFEQNQLEGGSAPSRKEKHSPDGVDGAPRLSEEVWRRRREVNALASAYCPVGCL